MPERYKERPNSMIGLRSGPVKYSRSISAPPLTQDLGDDKVVCRNRSATIEDQLVAPSSETVFDVTVKYFLCLLIFYEPCVCFVCSVSGKKQSKNKKPDQLDQRVKGRVGSSPMLVIFKFWNFESVKRMSTNTEWVTYAQSILGWSSFPREPRPRLHPCLLNVNQVNFKYAE